MDNRGLPKTLLEAAECCASASPSSCQCTSDSPLSFCPPLFQHLLFSCSLRCVPLHSCSMFLTLQALPGMYKRGTNSGCGVAALPQRETFIKQSRAGLGPPAATYAPANLFWAVVPTRPRGQFDASITEREKPYGEKGFVCPLLYPKELIYWESKRINTTLYNLRNRTWCLMLSCPYTVQEGRGDKALSCREHFNMSQRK